MSLKLKYSNPFVILGALIFSLPAFADSAGSYSLGIICHLVPTPKCHISVTISGPLDIERDKIGRMDIFLKSNNIYVRNGTYEGNLVVLGDKSSLLDMPIKLSVENGRVRLEQSASIRGRIANIRFSGHSTIHWASSPILRPNALALMVSNLSMGIGSMKAILVYKGHYVASSIVRMQPAKGCWVNEKECQPH